jgi:uncharacterized membrane protein YedE/YeeE
VTSRDALRSSRVWSARHSSTVSSPHCQKAQIDASFASLVVAGFLVGIGTRYGAGCTSGHGVSRLSPRSIVATIVFMAAGFATAYVIRPRG